MKYKSELMAASTFAIICGALVLVNADVARVTDYRTPAMVTEINVLVDAVNSILDASNKVEGSMLKNDSVGKAAIGVVSQTDTNVTTVASRYVPDYIGQVLVGGAGPSTNAMWISKGSTTNDWKKITLAE